MSITERLDIGEVSNEQALAPNHDLSSDETQNEIE